MVTVAQAAVVMVRRVTMVQARFGATAGVAVAAVPIPKTALVAADAPAPEAPATHGVDKPAISSLPQAPAVPARSCWLHRTA